MAANTKELMRPSAAPLLLWFLVIGCEYETFKAILVLHVREAGRWAVARASRGPLNHSSFGILNTVITTKTFRHDAVAVIVGGIGLSCITARDNAILVLHVGTTSKTGRRNVGQSPLHH